MQRNWIGRSEGARVIFRVDGTRRGAARLHDAAGHALRRDLLRAGARASARPAAVTDVPSEVREYVRHAGARSAVEREKKEKDGVFTGRYAINPVNGERDPDLGRRLRADGVRHRRDHGRARARRARLRVRANATGCRSGRSSKPADGEAPEAGAYVAHTENEVLVNSAGSTACRRRRRRRRSSSGSPSAARRGDDRLPPARLAALAAALLGLPDPDRPLRALRARARARRPAAGRAARGRGLPAEGPLAAGGRRGLGATSTCPTLRRPGAARDGHDGHVRRLVLVLHPLHATRRTTRRRSRARSPTTGCRSTSTSAASSTRSCTCCTRASSRR